MEKSAYELLIDQTEEEINQAQERALEYQHAKYVLEDYRKIIEIMNELLKPSHFKIGLDRVYEWKVEDISAVEATRPLQD